MGERSVLIVGAGIAGLTAAHRLAHAGWSVTLLEAAVQPGGRIKSIRPPSLSAPVELGAEFIHGENVATWPWLRQAGLSTAEVPSGHWRLAGRHWREDNSFADLLASLVARVDRAGPDLTIQHFLRASEDLTEAERWSLREYVEGFHAADPGQISAQAVAASEAAAEETEGTRQFRVEQGYGALVNWLLADLSAFPVEVHLECRAKRVRWEQGSVRIQADTPRGKTSFAGDRAIVTVPVAVWRTDELQFEPELPGFRAALMDLVPGHVTKVALHFKSRVWPVERFGFIHSPDPWLPTWWSDERGEILTGWAGRAEGARS
ncbi:MAG: FAD-dependent oxidoreductase [Verrucomicrobiota bacterium]